MFLVEREPGRRDGEVHPSEDGIGLEMPEGFPRGESVLRVVRRVVVESKYGGVPAPPCSDRRSIFETAPPATCLRYRERKIGKDAGARDRLGAVELVYPVVSARVGIVDMSCQL